MKNGSIETCPLCNQPLHRKVPWKSFLGAMLFILGFVSFTGVCVGIAAIIVRAFLRLC